MTDRYYYSKEANAEEDAPLMLAAFDKLKVRLGSYAPGSVVGYVVCVALVDETGENVISDSLIAGVGYIQDELVIRLRQTVANSRKARLDAAEVSRKPT